MAILGISNLKFGYGDHIVLDGVNLTLEQGEHVGMVGRNGQGKSTLMKLIAGIGNLKPGSGQIQLTRGATAGYLHQDPDLDLNRTLREEAATVFAGLDAMHQQLHALTEQMADTQGSALEKLLKRYEKLEHKMQAAGGYAVDHQIDQALHGLGLGNETFDVKVEDLSGSQKGRLALAKLLLTEPDLLLLDEPTNHLDIAGREWLENYLINYRGAVILISHDRWLLDRVVSTIYEVEVGRVFDYPGNFAKYTELRTERRMVAQRVYEKQQDKIRQEKGFIDRYRSGQRSKQARGREKRLERFIDQKQVDRPLELDVMSLDLPAPPRAGDMILSCEGLSKVYDDGNKPLFKNLDLIVRRGDRIGIIGPNGAGKSTLVRCLLGEQQASSGETRLGAQVQIGHFRQTHADMAPHLTIIEYLSKHVPGESGQIARNLAGAFLFTGDDQEQTLGLLSGGERARVALAALMAGEHNLLVLDEPTNHLDVLSSQKLEEALEMFTADREGWGEKTRGGGTLILISHDRMLLDHLVDQLIIFDGQGNAKHVWGNYSQYTQGELTPTPVDVKPVKTKKTASKPKPQPKPQIQSKPKRSGALTKLSMEKLEQRIMTIEQALSDIDGSLADPAIYRDGTKVKDYQQRRDALREELTPLEEEWAARG